MTKGFKLEATYTSLPEDFYAEAQPAEFKDPLLVLLNEDLAQQLGLDLSSFSEEERARLFCGNLLLRQPFSQAYAGHQFGHFTNLGDGRAHMMGEHVTPSGERVDLQFKGSGRTPYSRGGDGLAALGPMLREYLISEAMHGLGIPTTRSLAVVTTGEPVMRERALPGAVMTRVASSHIRVGTFEYAAAMQTPPLLTSLLDYTIARHFPELEGRDDLALSFLTVAMERQVQLIVHWMRVGFIHGVMNTDNMALSGESIDFGPCAFMDSYDPEQVFSSIDRHGRYAYINQPQIAQWNLARLAESLLTLIDEDQEKAVEKAKAVIASFEVRYHREWLTMMREKLGLLSNESSHAQDDEQLITDLLEWMHQQKADFTNTFLDLSAETMPKGEAYDREDFKNWYARYEKRRLAHGQSREASMLLMKRVNPSVIPRNHKVEQALAEAEEGDLSLIFEFLTVLKNPYTEEEVDKKFQSPASPLERAYQTFCGT